MQSFPLIRRYYPDKAPRILYPAINEKNYILPADTKATSIGALLNRPDFAPGKTPLIITSLNRYERKKNINLALQAYAMFLKSTINESDKQDSVLVIAGGYDERMLENVDHHLELVNLANKLGIIDKVVFLRSISNDQRVLLLQSSDILLYTPANEHFGIVPVEAMWLGAVVIACNSGGPLESIEDGKTGFLRQPEP